MTNPEYFLVRLSAQSKGSDPKQPSGGKPELTAQDIQMLCSMVGSVFDYWAITAKYCQSEVAEKNLLQAMRHLSRRSWHETEAFRDIPVNTDELDRMAEASVLSFLNPRDSEGNLRGDQWAAAYMRCHRNTFVKKFKAHWLRLTAKLNQLETSGLADIRNALRD